MKREETVKKYIEALESLPIKDKAVLKRNAGNLLAESCGGAMTIFYRVLPYGVHPSQEEIWFAIATLRFLNRYLAASSEADQRDFGWTLQNLKKAYPSDSFDGRVRGLLDCQRIEEDGALTYRLRQLIKLADGKGISVDWEMLLCDLLSWNHPERWVQKKWARTCFNASAEGGHTQEREENQIAEGNVDDAN
ncbi:MAG: type I-E CRISPR-associated protein Cse2/CasB [Bacillota bacterium]|jgi:CRISPR system Cascade subunit CasB